tara:strand:+ start:910 stop:1434 length:525 start_codon:yes stop_codon:yes gene_type:complete
MNKEDCFYVGTIVRNYSFKGDLLVKTDSDNIENYINLKSIFMDLDTGLVPFFIQRCQIHKSALLRIKFDQVNSESDAKLLIKKDLFLPLSFLPKLKGKKFYFHEVIGFSLIERKKHIGKVIRIQDQGIQSLFEIEKIDGKLALIPITDQFILEINREAKTIQVQLPDGLLDLQN